MTCFSFGKIEFGTHWEFCAQRRIFDIRKGAEYLYQLFDVLPKQTICEIKALQVYKFTFNNDFMMNREINLCKVFSVIKNDFGNVLICWQVTLFVRVSYCDQVVEVNFRSINCDKLLRIVSFPANVIIYNIDALLMMY